jgi:hypothetical protein
MGLLHKHHIIPKHMGGSNDSSNIAYLTVQEHAEAHKKLYEQYGKWEDKIAWKGLAGIIGKEEICFEISRQNGLKNKGRPNKNKGKKFPHISEKLTGKPKSEQAKINMRGKRPHVNQSGSNNNNAKKIKTPYGTFESIKDASIQLNIKYDNLWYKLRSNQPGWERI